MKQEVGSLAKNNTIVKQDHTKTLGIDTLKIYYLKIENDAGLS